MIEAIDLESQSVAKKLTIDSFYLSQAFLISAIIARNFKHPEPLSLTVALQRFESLCPRGVPNVSQS